MGTIGATFIVIGIGLLYLMTGTLNLADMGRRIGAVQGTRPVLAALAFLTVGISLKLALFPLHQWLPNAYAYRAVGGVGLPGGDRHQGGGLRAAALLLLGLRPVAGVRPSCRCSEAMLLLALAGMFVASTIAIFQTDLKRLFAYSSVGQIGYIMLGLSFDSVTGLTATIVHLFNHGVTKGAIFLLLGGVALVDGRHQPGARPGPGQAHAADELRHRAVRAVADRRAGHGRLRQQVVPDPGGAARRASGGWCS